MKTFTKSFLFLAFALLAVSCKSGSSPTSGFSPVGTYRVDMTVAQSGVYTTIVLKSDGSAIEQQDGSSAKYTFWDDGYGDGIIRYGDIAYPYIMDFNTMTMYYGWDAFRSKDTRNAFKFRRQ